MTLVVTDMAGRRIGLPRSVLRSAIKFAPWELSHSLIWQLFLGDGRAPGSPVFVAGFGLVYALAGAYVLTMFIGASHRTVYDRLSGCAIGAARSGTRLRSANSISLGL